MAANVCCGSTLSHSAMSDQCPLLPTLRTQVGHLARSEKCRFCCKSILSIRARNIDSRSRTNAQHRLNEAALAALNAGVGVPTASSEAGAVRSTLMPTSKISTHPRDDSVRTFRNSVALVWPPWPEGRCQASNAAVVAGDVFATPNPLTSHTEKNLLSPFSNIRAITARLCTRSRLAILEDYCP
jgi:hypothetical protein